MIKLKILKKEPLARHCTYRTGGPADYFAEAEKTQEIAQLIRFANQNSLPYLIIGKASNVLFDDKGFRGLVIKIATSKIKINGTEITADAGVTIAQLIKKASENKFQDLKKWIGLPGTVGGAVRGNAGCNGLEIKDILKKALILDPKTGKTKELDKKDLKFSYRKSILKDSDKILLTAIFKLKKSQTKSPKIIIKKRPYGLSAGSFFKNPSSKNPAGALIEKAGLKGKTLKKAKISPQHANFIINTGGAKSSAILKLARLVKRTIKAKFNIELKEEVQIFSEHGKTKL